MQFNTEILEGTDYAAVVSCLLLWYDNNEYNKYCIRKEEIIWLLFDERNDDQRKK